MTFNPAVWVIVVLFAINVLLAPVVHGEDRGPWNGFMVIFGAGLSITLLYFGGFFA